MNFNRIIGLLEQLAITLEEWQERLKSPFLYLGMLRISYDDMTIKKSNCSSGHYCLEIHEMEKWKNYLLFVPCDLDSMEVVLLASAIVW